MNVADSIHGRNDALSRSRGVASLAVTLIMLALSALVILYANRGQLFEQRTSANQARATTAFEAAEAGIEWALARLNDETNILPSATSTCTHSSAGSAAPFATNYAQSGAHPADPDNPTAFAFTVPNNARAACSINETTGVPTCHCPVPNNNIVLASPGRLSFEVTYGPVADDLGSVRITSVGCRDAVNSSGNPIPCSRTPPSGSTNDGFSTITILAKYVPAVGSVPRSALTAGGYGAVCGAYSITNTSSVAGGILVNSGDETNVGNMNGQGIYASGPLPPGARNCGGGGAQVMVTLPGTPVSAAIIPNDAALTAAAARPDSMMFAYFGMTVEQYKAPPTCVISGNNIESDVRTAYGRNTNPCTRFWLDGPVTFNNGGGQLGTPARPIMLASAHNMNLNNVTVYGIIYSDSPNLIDNGTGSATITGQIVARGGFYANGSGSLVYNDAVLRAFAGGSGEFIRVPGSWKDF